MNEVIVKIQRSDFVNKELWIYLINEHNCELIKEDDFEGPEFDFFVRILYGKTSAKFFYYVINHRMNEYLQLAKNCRYIPLEPLSLLAVEKQDFEMLNWIKENNFPIHKSCMEEAIYVQNLNLVKWLKNNGCQLESKHYVYAANLLNYNILNYLHKEKCPLPERWPLLLIRNPHFYDWLNKKGYIKS